jgi:hypothetical protein
MKIQSTLVLNESKKHSVRYDAEPGDKIPLATSVYVMKLAMAANNGNPAQPPRKIRVTVESVED